MNWTPADERLDKSQKWVVAGCDPESKQGWPRFLFSAVASTKRKSVATGFLFMVSFSQQRPLAPSLSLPLHKPTQQLTHFSEVRSFGPKSMN